MFEELAGQVKESNVFYERNSLAVRRFFLCCARVIDAEFNVLFNDYFHATDSVWVRWIGSK